MQDIAILHDRWTEMGGAEHVAVEMARMFDAPIYVARKDPDAVPDDVDVRDAFSRWWEQAAMKRHHLIQDAVQMLAWQHVEDIHDFDTVILNKNNPGWYVPKDDQTVVKYCHTTPRLPYDLFHEHGDHYFSRLTKFPVRPLYRPNISYPDAWACNSDLVQHRVDKYWDKTPKETTVIYPPVNVDSYGQHHATGGEDYYFTMSRLVGHKRITQIAQAFRDLGDDYHLRIAGSGPKHDEISEIASDCDNITVMGYVSEAAKRQLLADATAFVFNATNEDFGLAPVEAMASGTPVLGVEDGFTQYQIIDGKNGFTYPRGGLRESVRYFDRDGVDWSGEQIESFADQFSTDRFRDEFRALVRNAQEHASVRPDWAVDPRGKTPEDTGAEAPDGEIAIPDGGNN